MAVLVDIPPQRFIGRFKVSRCFLESEEIKKFWQIILPLEISWRYGEMAEVIGMSQVFEYHEEGTEIPEYTVTSTGYKAGQWTISAERIKE